MAEVCIWAECNELLQNINYPDLCLLNCKIYRKRTLIIQKPKLIKANVRSLDSGNKTLGSIFKVQIKWKDGYTND